MKQETKRYQNYRAGVTGDPEVQLIRTRPVHLITRVRFHSFKNKMGM